MVKSVYIYGGNYQEGALKGMLAFLKDRWAINAFVLQVRLAQDTLTQNTVAWEDDELIGNQIEAARNVATALGLDFILAPVIQLSSGEEVNQLINPTNAQDWITSLGVALTTELPSGLSALDADVVLAFNQFDNLLLNEAWGDLFDSLSGLAPEGTQIHAAFSAFRNTVNYDSLVSAQWPNQADGFILSQMYPIQGYRDMRVGEIMKAMDGEVLNDGDLPAFPYPHYIGISAVFQKPSTLMIAFASVAQSGKNPWVINQADEYFEKDQAACYDAVFQKYGGSTEDTFGGFCVWRVESTLQDAFRESGSAGFVEKAKTYNPLFKEAEEIIRRQFDPFFNPSQGGGGHGGLFVTSVNGKGPGDVLLSTDDIAEAIGVTNLWFTQLRVLNTVLANLNVPDAPSTSITSTDALLAALAKLQKQINNRVISQPGYSLIENTLLTQITSFLATGVVDGNAFTDADTGMTHVQIRKDVTSNWISQNTVLRNGQIGYDIALRILKIGDGTSGWNELPGITIDGSAYSRTNASYVVELSSTDISNKFITLPSQATDAATIQVFVLGGGLMKKDVDFTVSSLEVITWDTKTLENILVAGDVLAIYYETQDGTE